MVVSDLRASFFFSFDMFSFRNSQISLKECLKELQATAKDFDSAKGRLVAAFEKGDNLVLHEGSECLSAKVVNYLKIHCGK